MYSSREIIQCIALVLLLMQPIFSEIIRFNDGGITYEYDNLSTPLGRGSYGKVYGGIRTEGNRTESVAFKELGGSHEKLLKESNISEILGRHESFPKFYRYFPATNDNKAIFVMKRIGKTLDSLWDEYRPFPSITVIQIGLQMLNAVEWMRVNGITHNDLHLSNVAVGYHDKSKIYLFDFSLAEMNKNKKSWDLDLVSGHLKQMIMSSFYGDIYEHNSALNEFDVIATQYGNICDDGFRNETFNKLTKILMTELESHKNDVNFEKYDIGSIEDAVDGLSLLRKLIKQNDTSAMENLIKTDQGLNINDGFGNSSYYKPIHLAAEIGNSRVVQTLIDHGAEINFKYNDTHYALSPLHIVAMKGYTDIVRILIEHGAEVNSKHVTRRTPLHWAVHNGWADVVQILCERGADIKAEDNTGKTPLHFAAWQGKIDVVRVLIDHGAEINANFNDGNTPLLYAAQYGYMDLVKFLIESGAEINVKCSEGRTPLHYVVQKRCVNVTQFLIEHGADIQAEDNNGKTPLHFAARRGNIKLVRMFYEFGADITTKCSEGKILLHYAAQSGNVELNQFLIEHGADIKAEDNSGKTPLHFAAMSGNIKLVRMFYELGADITAKCSEGKLLLHFAAQSGNVDLIQFLIIHGADIKAEDNSGKTPLHFAAMRGRLDAARIFCEHGADITAKCSEGKTPLHFAASSWNAKIIQFLIENGADIKAEDNFGTTPLDIAIDTGFEGGIDILKEAEQKLAKSMEYDV